MTTQIKHIVISGGGPLIFNIYGALKQSNLSKIWSHDNIESYHATSAGAVLAAMMTLKYDWEELDNYLINRPWHTILNFNVLNIYDYYLNNGIVDEKFIYSMFAPLLKAKDIDMDVDLDTFRKITGATISIYATEYSTFVTHEFSADATPTVKLLDAVYASMALPILCKPIKIEDKLYLDGGVFLNYPISKCMEKHHDCGTILGIKMHNVSKKEDINTDDLNMFSYMTTGINILYDKIQMKDVNPDIKNIQEIYISAVFDDMSSFFKLASSSEERKRAIERGYLDADALIVGNRLNKTN